MGFMKKVVARKSRTPISVSLAKSEFDVLNEKLDRVIDVMATKEELQLGLDELREETNQKFREMLIAIEGLMKPLSELKMEYTGMIFQLDRHEQWIKFLADKQGVILPR